VAEAVAAETAAAGADYMGSSSTPLQLGLGIGWRPQLAEFILGRRDLGFLEVVAESFPPGSPTPLALEVLHQQGLTVVPHGLRLGLGGADTPHRRRVAHLASAAERFGSPLISEHIAFVRGGDVEAGHLLPLPCTKAGLDVLVRNVRSVQPDLSAPLALEPIATLIAWPEPEMSEAAFLTEFLERTDAWLLLDVANVYANARNHAWGDRYQLLDDLPLERVAYVHVAGGTERGGLYHDTHSHPVPLEVLELLSALTSRRPPPGVMLERDDLFPSDDELGEELDRIATHGLGAERAVGAR
jgi:uncharacterized protein (UPF0276 family)